MNLTHLHCKYGKGIQGLTAFTLAKLDTFTILAMQMSKIHRPSCETLFNPDQACTVWEVCQVLSKIAERVASQVAESITQSVDYSPFAAVMYLTISSTIQQHTLAAKQCMTCTMCLLQRDCGACLWLAQVMVLMGLETICVHDEEDKHEAEQ